MLSVAWAFVLYSASHSSLEVVCRLGTPGTLPRFGAPQLYVNDDRRRVLEMYKGRTTPYYRWVDGAGIDEHLLIESDIDGDGFEDAEREYVCTDDLGK